MYIFFSDALTFGGSPRSIFFPTAIRCSHIKEPDSIKIDAFPAPFSDFKATVKMSQSGVKTSELISSDTDRKMIPLCSDIEAVIVRNPECVEQITIDNIEATLNKRTDLYELTWFKSDEDMCRAYIDIDGVMNGDVYETDFEAMDEAIKYVLSELDIGAPFSLMSASKYRNKDWKDKTIIKHKLSYRLTFTDRCGTKLAVKQWVMTDIFPRIRDALADVITVYKGISDADKTTVEKYLDFDTGVYRSHGKMRCYNSSKRNRRTGYDEDRKNVLVKGTVLDTLINYIPEGCIVLPPPEPPKPKTIIRIETPQSPVVSLPSFTGNDAEPTPSPPLSAEKKLIIRAMNGIDPNIKYPAWLQIGMACFNEEIPLEYWDLWSQHGSEYKSGECHRKWATFRKGGVISQTYIWARLKETNPTLFRELIGERKDFQKLLNNPSHYAVAEYIYNLRPYDYLYEPESGWYSITPTNVWTFTKGSNAPPSLTSRIVRILNTERIDLEAALIRKKRDAADKDENEILKSLDELTKKIVAFREKYENDVFLRGVTNQIRSFYAEQAVDLKIARGVPIDQSVASVFDTNTHLFAFSDQCYDLKEKTWKPIEPTDYITITTGYTRPERNPETRKQIMETLAGIWEDEEPRDYMLTLLASCLSGERNAEVFTILTGRGRNGKGLLWELVQATFGGYYYELPIKCLTTTLESSTSATPEFAGLRGRRITCPKEPESEQRLKEGTIKSITGGDQISARQLYGNPVSFKPQVGLFMQCNDIPLFNNISDGGILRLRVVPFPFKFVDNPQMSYERKGNPYIKNVLCKSTEWRNEFINILIDYFPKAQGKAIDAIPTPKIVKERSNEYAEENNGVGVWWFENYERVEGSYVGSREAFDAYKMETGKRISDRDFKKFLNFNNVEPKKVSRSTKNIGNGVEWKDKIAIENWRRKPEVELE